MDLLPNEQNFDLDTFRQKFHHSLKEHHKISNISRIHIRDGKLVLDGKLVCENPSEYEFRDG